MRACSVWTCGIAVAKMKAVVRAIVSCGTPHGEWDNAQMAQKTMTIVPQMIRPRKLFMTGPRKKSSTIDLHGESMTRSAKGWKRADT